VLHLWLVRHGQTDWNVERRLQGWTDIPLNSTGQAEADELGAALATVSFCHIYTSPLRRALETAERIQVYVGAPLTCDDRLKERGFGRLEGRVRGEDRETEPDVGVEADEAVRIRIQSFLEDTAKRHSTGRLLVVTHGGIIRMCLSMFGHTLAEPLDNASVTAIQMSQGRAHIHLVNARSPLFRQAATDRESSAMPTD